MIRYYRSYRKVCLSKTQSMNVYLPSPNDEFDECMLLVVQELLSIATIRKEMYFQIKIIIVYFDGSAVRGRNSELKGEANCFDEQGDSW